MGEIMMISMVSWRKWDWRKWNRLSAIFLILLPRHQCHMSRYRIALAHHSAGTSGCTCTVLTVYAYIIIATTFLHDII